MKITLTITKKTPVHITFQVFVNGGLSGSLILRNEEFNQFCEIMQPDRIRDDEFRGIDNTLNKVCNAENTRVKCRPPCKYCYGGEIITPSKL